MDCNLNFDNLLPHLVLNNPMHSSGHLAVQSAFMSHREGASLDERHRRGRWKRVERGENVSVTLKDKFFRERVQHF